MLKNLSTAALVRKMPLAFCLLILSVVVTSLISIAVNAKLSTRSVIAPASLLARHESIAFVTPAAFPPFAFAAESTITGKKQSDGSVIAASAFAPNGAQGPLTNGATQTGVIQVGGVDTWTIDATINDRITVSVGEVSGNGFSPRIRLQDPNGVLLADAFNNNGRDFSVQVSLTGTYTVLVSNQFPGSQVGNASYILTVVKTPGPYTISPGDEGGPVTNGATHTGVIGVGDMDTWAIDATANDRITVSVGEVSGNGFSPRIQLQGPNGTLLADAFNNNGRDFSVQVSLTGTYTILVSNQFPDSQVGNANYILTVVKTPGPYTISPGDEGGPITNGATHTGVIGVGDMDTWAIDATANDRITVSVGEVSGNGFSPRIQLQGPNGTLLADAFNNNGRDFSVQVSLTGTYTILVSNQFPDSQVGNANYILTVVKTPGPYTISPGDEGGPMTNGATHTGVIGVGDMDTWIFHATANNSISLNLNEVSGSNFSPRLQLIGPDGTTLNDLFGTDTAQISRIVPVTGVYTVLVSNQFPDSQVGSANYALTFTGPTQPTLSINSVTQNEGNSGTSAFTFNVTLSSAVTQIVTLKYETANGTATAPSDYVAIPSTPLTFNPGELTKTVNVLVNGDTDVEPNETFFVNLSGALNVRIANSQGTGTIVNDDVAPSSTIQFSSATYVVSEAGGKVDVTVTRSGNTGSAASVNYATSDNAGLVNCNVVNGFASAKCDYISAIGTLKFAAGETSKTISILIVNDKWMEGPETFNIGLSNVIGASAGNPTNATISINDDDTTNGPNPIDQSAFFVSEHYYDFLNRIPDSDGLNFWTSNIDNCTPKPSCTDLRRIDTSAAYFLSIEFQQTGYLVERIYKAAFGNGIGASTLAGAHTLAVPIVRFNEFLPDTQQIGQGVVVNVGNWQQQLESNKQAYALDFAQRTRFSSAFPTTMTPAAFVDALFNNAGVTPTTSDRNAAIAEFGAATNTADVAARGRALRDVAENSLLQQQEFNRAFVLMQFFGYLRRNPNDPQDIDYTGYEFWLNKLIQFNGNYNAAEMVKAFITSTEYRQRFGP